MSEHLHEHDHDHDDCCCCGHDHQAHDHDDHEAHHHEETQHHDDDCCGHDHDHEHEHHHHLDHAPTTPKSVYILENLSCAHCAAKMEEQINHLDGVEMATITYATKQLRLYADHPDQLLPSIEKICTTIEPDVQIIDRNVKEKQPAAQKEGLLHNRDFLAILAGAVFFAAGLIAQHMAAPSAAVLIVFVLSYLIVGGEVLLTAAKNIGHGQIFDENFLMCVATLGAFAIGEYPEAVGVMLFYRIGELFEDQAVSRSRSQIMDVIDMRPEVVNRLDGEDVSVIPAEDARVGDLLLIRPGDRIPLDGTLIKGESRLDTSAITGEPVPVAVKAGDSVISGCVNTSGQLTLRVDKPLEESMVSRIMDSVENAAASKPKIDRFITRFAKIYTPIVVFAALAVAIIPSLVSGNWNYWVYTALTFLVISCPCALVLSVPLAFFSGIGAGSKKGILFKGGASMEALSDLAAVVMDKTGTITEGNFVLQAMVSTGSRGEDDLLALCAACEQNSTHPIAESITKAAKDRGLTLETPETMDEIAGYGIAATLHGAHILCGNRKLMEREKISMECLDAAPTGVEIFLAVDGKLEGYAVVSDTIKADAAPAISRLKSMGLATIMLTGDAEANARSVADATGIDEVFAKLLPDDKVQNMEKMREKYGKVAFVGDGINDAPVLAGADVGIAMGSGADAAIEAADAVLMTQGVDAVPEAISLSRQASRIARQNVVFALIIKALVMVLGLTGHANMWMAVFADTGVAMLCVLNSVRILYKK